VVHGSAISHLRYPPRSPSAQPRLSLLPDATMAAPPLPTPGVMPAAPVPWCPRLRPRAIQPRRREDRRVPFFPRRLSLPTPLHFFPNPRSPGPIAPAAIPSRARPCARSSSTSTAMRRCQSSRPHPNRRGNLGPRPRSP
jgi:hypothetical protein